MKKQNLLLVIFSLFLFLIISSHARRLPQDQASATAAADHDDIMDLVGSEECHEKDEECLQRRMVAEAHLDYIYTQHQKP
ncbi:hypothetical protein ACLB2K_065790 [Fragaria x ananassa]